MRIAPQTTWDGPDGAVWLVEGGASTREVLEAEAWHSYKFATEREYGIADPTPLARWCAPYVREIREDSPVDDPSWSLVEARLTQPSLLELKEKIIELSMYEEDLLDQLYDYWKVALDGGCECPICKGLVERHEASHPAKEACQVPQDVPEEALHIARLYSGLEEEDLLDEPWWLYQLHCTYRRAKVDLMDEQDEEKSKAEEAQELTRQHGVV